ncbi:hypothetical protein POK33_38550 [Burkholderia cenocepacia]|uniref:hypothetical protein n=1 Tax=Burkholderia cenocepacia TaxID=95486 RepID=UPI0023B8EEED|nr:hypothetical protein [Burkholderia cenocepacia]MDF0506657.1 hypothetical protein [Burkholderia cenocepacia]
MAGDVHKSLVALGEKWLKRQGFAVIASELVTGATREQADVIGFRSTCSALIEAKATRADFLADARKPHRVTGGLGVYRFYLCPPGVIEVADLPERWGLLYADGRSVLDVLRPTGNGWPSFGAQFGDWPSFQHAVDTEAERGVLFSIARRRSLSRSDERYEARLQVETRRADRLARENCDLAEKVRKLELDLYLATRGLHADTRNTEEPSTAIRRKIA